ncbi:MAG: Sapep family Mn(2+)-dependent dipeptidase [Acholeplasmatales bacterium]|nr:Sapep family Mn(2+)-dependent dipeptidase [Acholeplasmatales bacterium]
MDELDLLITKYKDLGIDILKRLVSIDSILDNFDENSDAPFGVKNKECLEEFLKIGNELGFKTYNHKNYFGCLDYGDGDELVLILCHLDVVPVVSNEWKTNPFELSISNGNMYGRGTTDDKGPLTAILIALKALKDNNFMPNKKIRLFAGCDEESGSRCVKEYKKVFGDADYAFSPDADFPLICGEKAIISYDIIGDVSEDIFVSCEAGERYNIVPSKCEFKLKKDLKYQFIEYLKTNKYRGGILNEDTYVVYGVASHAMDPDKGLNAIYIMFDFLVKNSTSNLARFIDKYYLWDNKGKKAGYADYDTFMKELTSNLAFIRINGSKLRMGFNVRAPHDESFDIIPDCVGKNCREFGYDLNFLGGSLSHLVDNNSYFVNTLLNAYKKISGDYNCKPIAIGGGTYAREFKNGVAFGPQKPGKEDLCHISNEYMSIEDFEFAIKVYYEAIKELTK